jgi:hypothetical protein
MEILIRCLREAEAAEYLQVSKSYLRQARSTRANHGPPYVKLNRAVRCLIDDLDKWLDQNRRGVNHAGE